MIPDDNDPCWKFGHWARFGAKGTQFTYYEGDLAADRAAWANGTLSWTTESLELAERAMVAAQAGYVHLTQRRLPSADPDKSVFEYIAIKA